MKSVMHNQARVPQADIPRSTFDLSFGHKSTIDADYLYPIFATEALPGDTFNVKPTLFARMATPIYPIMDNLKLSIHWFSVPKRQIWDNFRKFMGEQVNPGDSTDYTIPVNTITSGVVEGRMEDYLGLPLGLPLTYNALFQRAYYKCYDEWFRDQNLINSVAVATGDTGQTLGSGSLLRKRAKAGDYFTSALPWLQKGDSVNIPFDGNADIVAGAGNQNFRLFNNANGAFTDVVQDASTYNLSGLTINSSGTFQTMDWADNEGDVVPNIEADLNSAAATINGLRMAFQIQKLLERDARSGSRYSEIVKSHFGVDFLDVTYRPEYLGGGTTPINVHSVPSTAGTGTGAEIGDLGAFATGLLNSGGFVKSFTEHCIVLGIVSITADLTYSQGIQRQFSRSTRYDHYFPALAHLGEQEILNKEIYYQNAAADDLVFGYQERWAEYRYKQSQITGQFRSSATTPLDAWHVSQEFASLPTLSQDFIEYDTPIDRVIQTPTEPHFIFDSYFDFKAARPMPVYSVPGLIDHF